MFPLLDEILQNNINYLFVLMNLFCVLMILPLPETLGKPLEENIKELDESN